MMLEHESLQSKEDYINSFLDRLEGETLGKMLDYLSSQLTDSATQETARDMLEKAEGQPDEAESARQQEQDHIFSEIVKVQVFFGILNIIKNINSLGYSKHS